MELVHLFMNPVGHSLQVICLDTFSRETITRIDLVVLTR